MSPQTTALAVLVVGATISLYINYLTYRKVKTMPDDIAALQAAAQKISTALTDIATAVRDVSTAQVDAVNRLKGNSTNPTMIQQVTDQLSQASVTLESNAAQLELTAGNLAAIGQPPASTGSPAQPAGDGSVPAPAGDGSTPAQQPNITQDPGAI